MRSLGINDFPETESATLVHLADETEYLGYIAISDTIKKDASAAIQGLKDAGVRSAVMLTGDRQAVA